MFGDYDFCEDKTPPRVYVLGNAGSGKTTFIELVKENWDKSTESDSPCPELIEISGFDLDFDFKDELGDDILTRVCFLHDINLPFSDNEENAIKEILRIEESNALFRAYLILTKLDAANLDEDALKSKLKEAGEKFERRFYAILKEETGENSRFQNLLSSMVVGFNIARLKIFSDYMHKSFEYFDEARKEMKANRNSEQHKKTKEMMQDMSEDERTVFIVNALMARAKEEEKISTSLPGIFRDTMKYCSENPVLSDAIKKSLEHQIVLLENDALDVPEEHRFTEAAKIAVSTNRTFQAVRNYKDFDEDKICVLNFANSFNPGGGVVHGAKAQEESLCRCSTLYPCISEKSTVKKFHNAHSSALESGNMTQLANDDCIYTSDVVVFKSDEILPELLPESEWFKTDVITCAAPNLKGIENMTISEKEFRLIHYKRGKRIFDLAKSQKVDHLILGAFGCGAFGNPPEVVAEIYKKLAEEYKLDFKTIEFAVYCRDWETENYKAFKKVFEQLS